MSLKAEKIILDLLADGKEHSSDEIRRVLAQKGILSNRKYDVLRMSIYQLRKNGTEIYSRKRGVYQIEQKEKPDEIKKIILIRKTSLLCCRKKKQLRNISIFRRMAISD